jgi:MFS family permease
MIAVGWGVFSWLAPAYARNEIGIGTPLIGLLLLANAATVIVAQVPVARLAEGRRRVVLIALAAVIFVAACLLVVVAGTAPARPTRPWSPRRSRSASASAAGRAGDPQVPGPRHAAGRDPGGAAGARRRLA